MIDWLTVESVITAYRTRKLDSAYVNFEIRGNAIGFAIKNDTISVYVTMYNDGAGKELMKPVPLETFDFTTERMIDKLLQTHV